MVVGYGVCAMDAGGGGGWSVVVVDGCGDGWSLVLMHLEFLLMSRYRDPPEVTD